MVISAAQIRAARALVGWTQAQLAANSGLSEISIQNIEKGATDPRASTLAAIERALEAAGVEFTNGGRPGVRFREAAPTHIREEAMTTVRDGDNSTPEFISEDDVHTFEGYLRYQGIDAATATPADLAIWRGIFDRATERRLADPKVGLMKLQPVPGEHRYAVAVCEGSDLWLTLWVKRSRKGEFFVMVPRNKRDWDAHTSYHLDGTLHMKSHGNKGLSVNRQPLTGAFQGTVNLGSNMGHSPKSVGAICDPNAFSGVVEVAPGVLGPRNGAVVVDLVEPGCEPLAWPGTQVAEQVFRDVVPNIVIRIFA